MSDDNVFVLSLIIVEIIFMPRFPLHGAMFTIGNIGKEITSWEMFCQGLVIKVSLGLLDDLEFCVINIYSQGFCFVDIAKQTKTVNLTFWTNYTQKMPRG